VLHLGYRRRVSFALCIALEVHLLYGLPRPAHGRRGWARPLPSREGVGDGWSSFFVRSPSSAPVTRPTVLRSPSKSPSRRTGAQPGGARWADLAHGLQRLLPRSGSRSASEATRHHPRAGVCRGRRDTKCAARLARWTSRREQIERFSDFAPMDQNQAASHSGQNRALFSNAEVPTTCPTLPKS
jgi:hypothetical protein